ncbi:hypothetical protein EAF07_07040 [Streptococcus hillyeri]|uniref:Uncharacterized protein n=1 Tax=Streptococcus hillyeri TaxID=2282420 RepID=A0A3L9DPU4_9STRE|nr:hypothetical protein EAF07_07040 [Streptococcus hillyeri]
MKNVINKKVNGNVNNIDNSIKQTNNYFLTNITTNVGESGSSSGEAEMFGIWNSCTSCNGNFSYIF